MYDNVKKKVKSADGVYPAAQGAAISPRGGATARGGARQSKAGRQGVPLSTGRGGGRGAACNRMYRTRQV